MYSITLRLHRRKFYVFIGSIAFTIGKNLSGSAASRASDILARCNSLQTATAVLTMPTERDLPSDVIATLLTCSAKTWNDLDDVTKVGLLWMHGYVFSGGSSNGKKCGDTLVEVYTRCVDNETSGMAMADIGVSYDELTGQGSQCEVASCGLAYQATNVNCVANVMNAFQCAINGESKRLQAANNRSFWSSASSTSTVPYPQAFHHNIPLRDQTATLQVYSIHMHNNDDGFLCDSTVDTIIPCLRLEDVTRTELRGALKFCKPTVDRVRIQRFLGSTSTVQMVKQWSAHTSSDIHNDIAQILGAGFIGGLLVVLVLLAVYCCCCNSRMQNSRHTPAITEARVIEEQTETANEAHTDATCIARMSREASCSDNSLHIVTNDRIQTHRRLSWYTFKNAGNRESTVCGRSSSMAVTRVGVGAGAKTLSEYCNKSKILTAFVQDPNISTNRISFDELTFLRVLSNGACGEVWLGQYKTRHVAIKRLLPEKCHLTASLEQFAGEIQLMCTLQHRSIISFTGVSWNRLQNLCAVVEYMDAGDLEEVLTKNQETLTWQREKISIAMDIAEGLVYLHCLRPVIVHRDLKSKNVLLNRNFQAKLSDFGVSRKTQVNETMTSGVGTLLWTAPEIIEGKKYSEKADIYSLGVVLSEMDTCKPPFVDITSDKGKRLPGMQLVQLVRLGNIRVSLQTDCPPALRKIIMDCTELDPDARPSSMQVAFTLKSIIAPTLQKSVPTTPTTNLIREVSSKVSDPD